jgi:hypothetical protein
MVMMDPEVLVIMPGNTLCIIRYIGVTLIEGCDDDAGVEQNATLRHLRLSLTAEASARLAWRPAGTFLLEMLPRR